MSAHKRPKKDERLAMLVRTIVAAETNLVLARKILKDIYGSKVASMLPVPNADKAPLSARSEGVPGPEGWFDGHYMVVNEKEKYQVPENYASKSELIFGDKLKVLKREDGNWFKQVDKLEREVVTGILARSGENKWKLVTEDGAYALLSAAVAYHKGEEGMEAQGVIPAGKKDVPFAALRGLVKEEADVPDSKKSGGAEEKTSVRPAGKPAKKTEKKKKEEKENKKTKKQTIQKTSEEEKEEKVEKKEKKKQEKKEVKKPAVKKDIAEKTTGDKKNKKDEEPSKEAEPAVLDELDEDELR